MIPHAAAAKQLLDLPNELLAAVASQLHRKDNFHWSRGSSDLCRLALVCKRLREVVQVVLVKPVQLANWPARSVRKLLPTLAARTELAKRITHLDLGDYGDSQDCAGDAEIREYSAFVREVAGLPTWVEMIRSRNRPDPYGRAMSYHLAILIVMCPNLRELTFQMPAIVLPSFLITPFGGPVLQKKQVPFNSTIMILLAAKLETLTIAENSPYKGRIMDNPDLTSLKRLTRLSVPIEAITVEDGSILHPAQLLPRSLKRLEVRGCNRRLDSLLPMLHADASSPPLLNGLVLYFECTLRSAIIAFGASGHSGIPMNIHTALLQLTSKHGISITTYARPDIPSLRRQNASYTAANFLEEFDAYACLSPEELAIAGVRNAPLSDIVARTEDGKPRKRSNFEKRLFTTFWNMPLSLFTSPNFNADNWAGVRMFNGNKDQRVRKKEATVHPTTTPVAKPSSTTTAVPNPSSTASASVPPTANWSSNSISNTKPKPETWSKNKTPKTEKKPKQIEAAKKINYKVFAKPPELGGPDLPCTATFDTTSWMDTTFFTMADDMDTPLDPVTTPPATKPPTAEPRVNPSRRTGISREGDNSVDDIVKMVKKWRL